MRRRTAIKGISVLAAGVALLPSCSESLVLTHLPEEDLDFNTVQGTWLEAISEAILPKGDSPLNTLETFPSFVAQHLNVLAPAEDLTTFVNGYNLCTEEIASIYESDTDDISPSQIVSYFTDQLSMQKVATASPDDQTEVDEEPKKLFCETIRSLSIQHLVSSKEYQEDVLEYKLVPKKYQACTTI